MKLCKIDVLRYMQEVYTFNTKTSCKQDSLSLHNIRKDEYNDCLMFLIINSISNFIYFIKII